MTENRQEICQQIDEMHQRIEQVSYYELLELEPEQADERSVVKQFRLKARDWHADRFGAVDLDDDYRQKLQEIFAALNTAQQTLVDAQKRAEYDLKLETGDQNIEDIIDAENSFRRGKSMLQRGDYQAAHEQFARAVELHADEQDYRAHYLYTEYLQLPKNEAGISLNRTRAQEIHRELDAISAKKPEDDSLLTFLGVVALGLNQVNQAKGLFTEALQHNPRNVEAQRQRRLITMREEREANKGFFGKLMDKFRS